jgi:hypothetical protein
MSPSGYAEGTERSRTISCIKSIKLLSDSSKVPEGPMIIYNEL